MYGCHELAAFFISVVVLTTKHFLVLGVILLTK